jgi:hypothetical protein
MADIIEQSDMLLKDFNSSGYISKYVMEVLPQLVAEIKRLQAQVESQSESIQILCRDLDPQLHHLMKGKQELREQLATLQKIAIEATAKHNLINALDAREREYLTWENSNPDTKQSFMETAAEELGLQMKQEAGYLERLEAAYTRCRIAYNQANDRDLPSYDRRTDEELRKQARAALEKIRKG